MSTEAEEHVLVRTHLIDTHREAVPVQGGGKDRVDIVHDYHGNAAVQNGVLRPRGEAIPCACMPNATQPSVHCVTPETLQLFEHMHSCPVRLELHCLV